MLMLCPLVMVFTNNAEQVTNLLLRSKPCYFLNASIGESCEAFQAGQMPKITPTAAENPTAMMIVETGTEN